MPATKSVFGLKWGMLFALLWAAAAEAERLPIQADVDLCALRAVEHGDSSLAGSVQLQLLTRADGKVYAAYVFSGRGISDKIFEICLASNALLWQYPPVGLDTSAPFPISVSPGGATAGNGHNSQVAPQVFLPSAHPDVEPSDLDVPRAQMSLNVLDDATFAERGQADLAVHKYPEAIAQFREALEKDGNDRLALRGLAQALAESHGDMKEAHEVADKLVRIAPDSVVGAEAMLRVCSAAKEDACVWEAWKRARATADSAPRSRILKDELQPMVEKAALRLRTSTQERKSQMAAETGVPAAPVDPCVSEPAADKQALCEVKRCLDAGSALYAQEISKDGVEFEAGDWRFKDAGGNRLLVTRPISSKAKEGAPVQHRDALFLVKIGEKFSIQPSSADARVIARDHNGCAPRAAAQAPSASPQASPSAAPDAGTPAPTDAGSPAAK